MIPSPSPNKGCTPSRLSAIKVYDVGVSIGSRLWLHLLFSQCHFSPACHHPLESVNADSAPVPMFPTANLDTNDADAVLTNRHYISHYVTTTPCTTAITIKATICRRYCWRCSYPGCVVVADTDRPVGTGHQAPRNSAQSRTTRYFQQVTREQRRFRKSPVRGFA